MKTSMFLATMIAATGFVALDAQADSQFIYHPKQTYSRQSDSPFDLRGGEYYIENFEDELVNTLGLSAEGGAIRNPARFTDSVDRDDRVGDGQGSDGHSYWTLDGPAGMTFAFDERALDGLPTEVGFVWTDGNQRADFTFEAFDRAGLSLGSMTAVLGDGVHTGSTLADRFLGVQTDRGISFIHLYTDRGGLEVDHVQYGSIIPLPAPLALGLAGLAGVVVLRRRKH